MRYFNTAGPVNPKLHYCVSHRLDEAKIWQLIEQQKYFVLHAPRQSGKTTALCAFLEGVNRSGRYSALYINLEPVQAARQQVEKGLFTALKIIKSSLEEAFPNTPALAYFDTLKAEEISGNSLFECLTYVSMHIGKPLVLVIDEIDALVGDTLISVLRQLRAGYVKRPERFPLALCLLGVRDVRDYRIWSQEEGNFILGGSAFNIKAESLLLSDFSQEQVIDLYRQHTEETGQRFTDEAYEYAFTLTQGQPWLVNALAYQACFEDILDRRIPITRDVIERAKEALIMRRDTHLDVLINYLGEPRVRYIIDAMISGQGEDQNFKIDDVNYVRDLGLVSRVNLSIANPIYREVVPRELISSKQEMILQQLQWYQGADGSLDMCKLLHAFTQFYRENSPIWLEQFDYKESGPHLLLMAFLQRVINGGGKIYREYALGRKRVDLLLEWPPSGQRIVIELKIRRSDATMTEGLAQTAEYMDHNNATEGHLVLFDRTTGRSWNEKIFSQKHTFNTRTIFVWGM